MSQVYTTRRRAAPNGAEPAAPSSKAQQPEVNQGSLSLDGGGMGSRLDELMQEKMRQHFLDNQIPEAEREADRLASAAQGARTPEEVKARMGQRLGADFSGVRFHADSGALRTAEDMGARAYATGRDIYFGQGGFDPAVAAHELVHTVQQGQVESSAPTVSAPAGQVQMLPKRLKAFGHSVAQAAKAAGSRIKSFFQPSESQKADRELQEQKKYFPAIGARRDMIMAAHQAREQQGAAAKAYARSTGSMAGDGRITETSGGRQYLSAFRPGDDQYNQTLEQFWTPDQGLRPGQSQDELMNRYTALATPIFQQLMALDTDTLGTDEASVRQHYLENNELVGRLNTLGDMRHQMKPHLPPNFDIQGRALSQLGIDPVEFTQKQVTSAKKGKDMQRAMGIAGRMDKSYMDLMAGKNGPEEGANLQYDEMIKKRGQKKWWQFWK